MKRIAFLVVCSLATELLAATPPAPETASGAGAEPVSHDVYSLQLSFLSPGVVRSSDGFSFLSPVDFLNGRAKKKAIDYASVYCPIDIGVSGAFRGHANYLLAVNLLGNTLADDSRGGYPLEGVVPTRETSCLVHGLQVALLGNSLESVDGIQLAGGLNSSSYFRGVQFSGIVNHVFDAKGVQVAALFGNVCDSLAGVQIGLFNVATEGRGLQLGLVNLLHGRSAGLQIGLLNRNLASGTLPIVNVAY